MVHAAETQCDQRVLGNHGEPPATAITPWPQLIGSEFAANVYICKMKDRE